MRKTNTVPASSAAPPACAEFFVFRTPLLPLAELVELGHDMRAPTAHADALAGALEHDAEVVRHRLRQAFDRAELREALMVASPSLQGSFGEWLRAPKSERGQKVERSLIRYFSRMTFRATPFGLFAGGSVGAVGERTRLVVGERGSYRHHARLDMHYLAILAEALARDPSIAPSLTYSVNSSLYRVGKAVRFAEARSSTGGVSYRLVGAEHSDYLERVLSRAQHGAKLEEIIDVLTMDPEIERAEATEFLAELVRSQVLVPELQPGVTGGAPLQALTAALAADTSSQPVARVLAGVADQLEAINRAPLGLSPRLYDDVASALESLSAPIDRAKLIQVDMTKPAPRAELGAKLVAEINTGVGILLSLERPRGAGGLSRFKEAFERRYERQEVPLVEALDGELGIGFERASEASSPPQGGALPKSPSAQTAGSWGHREAHLLTLLQRLPADGSVPLELSAQDLVSLARDRAPRPLPNAYAVSATVDAASETGLESGDYTVHIRSAYGPSGALMLGRFCHTDSALEAYVRAHLKHEEAHEPGAIVAEIVHLPEGRLGNVLHRPVLREYEIPYLGRSGAPVDHQIPVTDLLVSVRFGRVVLRSRSLDREVVPRLTTAHNFSSGLPLYRFLCALQNQDNSVGARWDWGVLGNLPFLPRVTHGRFVFSLAQWRIAAAEIKSLHGATVEQNYAAVQQLRVRRHLPRWFGLVESDNVLLIDSHNPLSVQSFVELTHRGGSVQLQELFPAPDRLLAEGPEGRFTHELVLPLNKPLSPVRRVDGRNFRAPQTSPLVQRSLPPGSECLYLKLYTGAATADQLLQERVAVFVEQALQSGLAERWFFIRYGDPDWHLRVRLFGDKKRLWSELWPQIEGFFDPQRTGSKVWRVQLDTYERELERYGGPQGMVLSERLFDADSKAALAIVAATGDDESQELRWRLTLMGMDRLLDDFALEQPAKRDMMLSSRDAFAPELEGNAKLERTLGQRYRQERKTFDEAFAGPLSEDHPLSSGVQILEERSKAVRPIASALWELEKQGGLTCQVQELLRAYLHLQINRYLRSTPREQEMAMYDMLRRHYESLIARARKRGRFP
ncbi:MAG: lantibiotic dehydratase [Myxococcaceae bacterium]